MKNHNLEVYRELRENEKKYFWIRNKKTLIPDIIKTLIAAFLGASLFPLGIIFFFYFYQNKPKAFAIFILIATLAFSNLVPLTISLYYELLEAIEFSRTYL